MKREKDNDVKFILFLHVFLYENFENRTPSFIDINHIFNFHIHLFVINSIYNKFCCRNSNV